MANFQYQAIVSGWGSWTDVPKDAYYGTYDGDFVLEYPEAVSYDGMGRKCGAVGRPRVCLKSNVMTACGLQFWQNIIGAAISYSEDWPFRITAVNPRTGSWTGWEGYLARPTWGRAVQGTGSAQTLYYNVEININSLSAVTWP